jgi:hypothetical protein
MIERKIYTAMTSLLEVPNRVMDRIQSVFDLMEMAEDRIKHHRLDVEDLDNGLTDEQNHSLIWDSFKMMTPTDIFSEVGYTRPDVYRAHCDEIVERVLRGAGGGEMGERWRRATKPQIEEGTMAECLLALCAMSMKQPLNETAAGCYVICFNHCMPGALKRAGISDEVSEAFPGAATEFLEGLRHKMRDNSRCYGDDRFLRRDDPKCWDPYLPPDMRNGKETTEDNG